MSLRFLVFFLFLGLPAAVPAMEFTIERIDLRPVRPPTLHVTATGGIYTGDTEKLQAAMAAADKADVRDVLFLFDSPGGSLLEGLKMGAYIADIPAIVSAEVGTLKNPDAICASACVYAYLAADYRYLNNRARIGIHRFSLNNSELGGNQGAALGQAVSGILSEYVRTHRAKPEFFEAISAIDDDDVLWVPKSVLEEWHVVTNNVYDEQAAYINLDGKIALRMKQIAISGDSYLTLFCLDNGGLAGVADLHEPEFAFHGNFEFAVDGYWYPIPRWDVLDRSDMRSKVLFNMPPEVARAALSATSIGARIVVPSGNVFFGFEMDTGTDLVAEIIRGCPGAAEPVQASMVDQPGTDFPGGDLMSEDIRRVSFARCKQICLGSDQCQAVSYVQSKSWCWPKRRVVSRKPAEGLISAYKR